MSEKFLNPITNESWERWEIESLIGHLQNPESAPWLQGWSPLQQKLMIDGLKSLLGSAHDER